MGKLLTDLGTVQDRANSAEAARAAVMRDGEDKGLVWHAADDARRSSYLAGNSIAEVSRRMVQAAEAAIADLRKAADEAYDAAYADAFPETRGDMPTLEHALSIFAYHIGAIMTSTEHVRVHFYGDVTGDYVFKRDAEIPGDGDGAYVDGFCIGNRCRARNDYTERCAPVLAQIANYNNKDK